MAASLDFCANQIYRFSGMMGFPREDETFTELASTLARYAWSDEHAKDAVEAILETATAADRCPLQGDLRRVLYERRPEAAGKTCEKCCGRGWISADRIINGVSYPFASPCECRPKPRVETAAAPRRDGLTKASDALAVKP